VTCKDCEPGTKRPTPHPGPRCATHHRAVVKARREAARDKRIEQTYSLSPAEYEALLAIQGGVCAICRRATGKVRRLAVDHDHSCCDGPTSCGRCVRGLLCKPCNRMLGHLRDDPEAARRAAEYLTYPPARDLRSPTASVGPARASG